MFLSKKLLPIIFFSALAIIFSVPASAQTYRSYCWPEKQCKDKGGQYARTQKAEEECLKNYGFCYAKQTPYDLQIRIGETKTITGFAQYIEIVYKYLIGIVSIIAIVMIMVGGLRWLTSGGNTGAITQARQIMSNAAIGLILTLGSYTLLQTINPSLTKLTLPPLKMIAPESASQWCPNDGEFVGKFRCGNKFTKTTNPPSPVGSYCMGSYCEKWPKAPHLSLGCNRAADLIGAAPSDDQPPPLCFPDLVVKICKELTSKLEAICATYTPLDCTKHRILQLPAKIYNMPIPGCTYEPLSSIACEADRMSIAKTCGNFVTLAADDLDKFKNFVGMIDQVLENMKKK